MNAEVRVTIGDTAVRIQRISKAVVRIEEALPGGGFIDAATFTVLSRPQPAGPLLSAGDPKLGELACFGPYCIGLEPDCGDRGGSAGLCVRAGGKRLWSVAEDTELRTNPPQPQKLPDPHEVPAVWAFHDRSRLLPPEWGSLPPPKSVEIQDSGWKRVADTLDVYLFFCDRDPSLLWDEFMNLTGRIPVPPLWTFGFWTSRYYPYSEQSATEVIDRYEELGIPLDVFVLDTDWRVGGSRGYDINEELFPDMARFLSRCRARGIRTVFNDHPEPLGREPLDPELFTYRRENLTRLFDLGLSAWWFDRNWGDIIRSPAPGLSSAVWGQKLYYDIAESHRPEERAVVLSMTHPHAASHRYPIWWTGDINSDWRALAESVEDTLEDGLQLRPYTAPDIGGHVGFPSPEQYVRWLQWGSIAPTMRLHSGPHNRYRYPWRFGEAALSIVRDYIKMRYRLLPYIYALAHEAGETGMPLLRAPELSAGAVPEWARRTQFTIGEALLAAPVLSSMSTRVAEPNAYRFEKPLRRRAWVPDESTRRHLRTRTVPEYPPYEEGYDHEIRLPSWYTTDNTPPEGSAYFVVWEGELMVSEMCRLMFRATGNGTKALFIDEAEYGQLFSIFDSGTGEACLQLEAGTHRVWFGFWHHGGQIPACLLTVEREQEAEELLSLAAEASVQRRIWIPEGAWRDLYSGEIITGPRELERPAVLDKLPMFVRCGVILPLACGEHALRAAVWDSLELEVYPHAGTGISRCVVIEDDGESVRYREGEVQRTTFVLITEPGHIVLERAGAQVGWNPERKNRQYRIRVHLPPMARVASVALDEDGSWRTLSASGHRGTPIALNAEVAMFSDAETVLIEPKGPWSRIDISVHAPVYTADDLPTDRPRRTI
ncbi:MAG: TIM-barrel domain-containing protein [Spirochaetota bacterium]